MASAVNAFSLLLAGSKQALRMAVNLVATNNALVESLAARAYEAEVAKGSFDSLSAGDRAIWVARARNIIAGLGEAIG